MVNRLLRLLLVVAFATTPLLLSAQSTKRVEEQRQKVEQYRKDLERAKSEVSKLKKEKSSASERVKALNRQMNLRSNYIAETEHEKELVKDDIAAVDHLADSLQQALDRNRAIYGEAVRAAYRSYRRIPLQTIFSPRREYPMPHAVWLRCSTWQIAARRLPRR